MAILLGAIADDFTGATDLANNLVRAGMRTVQVIGTPGGNPALDEADAVVVALKSRACEPEKAVADSLDALEWLQRQGARQIFFKYCSTFDSTDKGNIGPVGDALLERMGVAQTVFVPAFPANGRTVYQGHLFVGDRLLNESGMERHPLNPMTDADLVRVLSRQSFHPVGLTDRAVIARGSEAVKHRLEALAARQVRHVICDTLDDADLEVLAEALADAPLVTGGSGLGQALPGAYRRRGWLDAGGEAGRLEPATGRALVLSGSCSRATLGQVRHFLERGAGFALDPLALAEGDAHLREALDFARHAFSRDTDAPVLIYASAEPERVRSIQRELGAAQAGRLVEKALGALAVTLVGEGVGRLIVAGGESSGAVVSSLGIEVLRIGAQIEPGVPWTQTRLSAAETPLSLALKSGNFGGEAFFTRAFEVLST